MQILNPKIARVNRDRDFGRVEAWVSLDLEYHPLLPARHEMVLVNAPTNSKNLRALLIAEARKLAVLLHRTDRRKMPISA